MKIKIYLCILFFQISGLNALACQGPQYEKAQDSDATVKFSGRPTDYLLIDINHHAFISFKTSGTSRGIKKPEWKVYFRSQSLPSDLAGFKKKFGDHVEVGLREMIAPGELSDSKKKAYYIVDAVCSMKGESWLIKKL